MTLDRSIKKVEEWKKAIEVMQQYGMKSKNLQKKKLLYGMTLKMKLHLMSLKLFIE